MLKNSKIFIAGHRGLVGSAISRRLVASGYTNVVVRPRSELDLCNPAQVDAFFQHERPEYVFLAAAKVGGILANSTRPAEFIKDNLLLQLNVIEAAWRSGVKKLVFMGSSCIYPKYAQQPIREEYMLTGELEPTNEPYAIAKIAGIKMVQAYRTQYGFNSISLMPTNLYGPGDNFQLSSCHVLPALLRKFHEAKVNRAVCVTVWGTGTPKREFLHVDDLAEAAVFLARHYDQPEIINVGTGEDVAISQLAHLIAEIVGYRGAISFDTSKPDGTPRKLLDITRIRTLGWKPSIDLETGIRRTYNWYLSNVANSGYVSDTGAAQPDQTAASA